MAELMSYKPGLRVALLTVAVCTAFAAIHLSQNSLNPTVFVAVGEEDLEIREYAERLLDDVVLRPELGHDGRFFFVQANDPWLLDPEDNAEILDRPVYRAQRMAYPVLASAGGLLPPGGVVWGMLIVNVLAMGAGAWASAVLANRYGGSAWWGLAFPLNIGLLSEFNIGGGGVVASAAAFVAVLALSNDRLLRGSLLFAVACLAREVMLISVAGTALWFLATHRRREATLVVLPSAAAVGVWALYVRGVFPEEEPVGAGNLGFPFVGFLKNFENWLRDPFELVVGLVVVLVLLIFLFRAWRTPSLTAWAFAPFAALAFLLAEPVWNGYFNITRAVAPAITAYFLVAFATTAEKQAELERANPIGSWVGAPRKAP